MGPFFFSSAVDRIESKNGSTLYREIKKEKKRKETKLSTPFRAVRFAVWFVCFVRFAFVFCLIFVGPSSARASADFHRLVVPSRTTLHNRSLSVVTEFFLPSFNVQSVGFCCFFLPFRQSTTKKPKKKKNRPTVRSSRREQRRTWQINKKKRKKPGNNSVTQRR